MTVAFTDPDVAKGIATFTSDYMGIRGDDCVVVAYTPDSREAAAAVMLDLRGRAATVVPIGMLPIKDHDLGERLDQALPAPKTVSGRLIVVTLEKETMSHFGTFQALLRRYESRCAVIRTISVSAELFQFAFRRTADQLSQRNAVLLQKLWGHKHLHVTSAAGTDLRMTVDSSVYEWISNRGAMRPGTFTILPAGEIATFPARINGTLVADGAFNCNVITRLNAALGANPVHVTVADGCAAELACKDASVQEFVERCFSRPYGRNVGELGFGTNDGVTQFVRDNSHMNERRPGIHLGFGQHNQRPDLVEYREEVHLDLISNGAIIAIEDAQGNDVDRVDLTDLPLDDQVEPGILQNLRSQDITGDCCGMRPTAVRVPDQPVDELPDLGEAGVNQF